MLPDEYVLSSNELMATSKSSLILGFLSHESSYAMLLSDTTRYVYKYTVVSTYC